MSTVRRRFYATLGCTFLCMTLIWRLALDENVTGNNTVGSTQRRHQNEASMDTALLLPGELPGYTGWARLEDTRAGSFRIISQDATAFVGNEWRVSVECRECHGNARFFARAYGPAVLAGRVQSTRNNVYAISFLPLDAGWYTVEVVLVSSGAPSWDDFPLVGEEPRYEGFLLAGFPLQLQVLPKAIHHHINRNCTLSDLLSETTESAYHKARWVVVDKVSHPSHISSIINASREVNIRDYRSGYQSLGIFMDYRYQHCALHSFSEASRLLNKHVSPHVHFIFIGDSVMRLQRTLFQTTFPNVQTTWIRTSGGMMQVMDNVTTQLQSLVNTTTGKQTFLLFNTGLHDISQLCSRVWFVKRHEYLNQSDANVSCTAQYQWLFQQLVDVIHNFPAQLKVFQTTTAGWLRYGNYGIEWLLNGTQDLALSSNMCQHFNAIAWNVLRKHSSIGIMDGYWITLARPDNRQIGLVRNLGRHLVHPGEEVLQAMVKNWIHIVLHHLETTE